MRSTGYPTPNPFQPVSGFGIPAAHYHPAICERPVVPYAWPTPDAEYAALKGLLLSLEARIAELETKLGGKA